MSRTAFPTAAILPAWEFGKAESRFSEVARLAREQDPQRVMLCGQDVVVVLSAADYARLALAAAEPTLFALFADSPFADLNNFDEQLAHERVPVRDVPDF